MARPGWSGFGLWSLAGALAALTFVTILSIGLFVLPFAGLAVIAAARLRPDPRHALGLVAGAGLVGLLVAAIHLDAHRSCTAVVGSCEEFDIRPWLAVGTGLVVTGVVAFAAALRAG